MLSFVNMHESMFTHAHRIKDSLTNELIFIRTIQEIQATNISKSLGFVYSCFSSIMVRFLKFTYKHLGNY